MSAHETEAVGTHSQPEAYPTNEFHFARTYEAPRDLVWKAWTEPDRLAKWWGPKGLDWIGCTQDLRPGGVFHYGLKAANGFEMWGKFVYREIVPQERLVYVVSFSDRDGGMTRHPMSATWPLEVLSTMTFTEHDGRTTIESRGIPINASEEECKTFEAGFDSMKKGFTGTLDQLAEYLAKL